VAFPAYDRTHPQALTRSARGPRSDSVTLPALLGLSLALEAAASRGLETCNGLRESSVARGASTTGAKAVGTPRPPAVGHGTARDCRAGRRRASDRSTCDRQRSHPQAPRGENRDRLAQTARARSRRPSLARDPANVNAGVAPPGTKHTTQLRALARPCQQRR
jgi:hypothetical protein